MMNAQVCHLKQELTLFTKLQFCTHATHSMHIVQNVIKYM